MPIHILPEPHDQAAESRRRIHRLAEETNSVAYGIQCLRDESRRVGARIQALRDQYLHFAQAAGRHVAAAVLAVTLFFASWVIDFIVLSPLADFMLDWAGMPAGPRVPTRIAFAFVWTLIGYSLGAKLGIGFHSHLAAAWLDLLPAAAYVAAMPVVAYFVSQPVFQGPARWMLLPITLVLSSLPVLSGYFATTAAEYLAFLTRFGMLKRHERRFERQTNRTGGELVVYSQRLAVAVNHHQRRFREQEQPYLTELARRLIEEFSSGNITVSMDQPRPLSPPPQPLPAATGNGAARAPEADNEAQPVQAGQASSNGSGASVSPEDADPPNGETEFLRRQLEQRAAAEDAELTPPREFSTRLP
jgi:hypothetical protein